MARRTRRPCITCGVLLRHGSYCALDDPRSGYRRRVYRETARRFLAQFVAENGPICPGAEELEHDAHPVEISELTVDHVVPLTGGGDLLDPENMRPLCRSWNSRRAHSKKAV
jgi:5-methylcytosine-specific restriction endonuclease McrA